MPLREQSRMSDEERLGYIRDQFDSDDDAILTLQDEHYAALSRIAELERVVEATRAEHAAALGLATARIRELEGGLMGMADILPTAEQLHEAMQLARHDGKPFRQGRAALLVVMSAIVARIEKDTK